MKCNLAQVVYGLTPDPYPLKADTVWRGHVMCQCISTLSCISLDYHLLCADVNCWTRYKSDTFLYSQEFQHQYQSRW